MALTGLIDLTIAAMLVYVYLLKKWGVQNTRPYRALVLVLYTVAALHSFGVRV